MVRANIDQETGNGTIILSPNNSASWNFNMKILGSQALIAFIVAVLFIERGMWLILPFSGLEIIALFAGLYYCVRNNFTTEVITFKDHVLTIERGHTKIENSWEYQRLWTKILVRTSTFRGHPRKILVRSHGKELEIGAFLNKSDKEKLIKKLKRIIYC
jgi:uncharacterized membrane protein